MHTSTTMAGDMDEEKLILCNMNHKDAECDKYRLSSAVEITNNDTMHCIDDRDTSSEVRFAINDGKCGDCGDEKVADSAHACAAS